MNDERVELSRILSSGFKYGNPSAWEIKILAKYYRAEFGYGTRRIKTHIEDFCKERIKDFDSLLYFRTINSAANKAVKNDDFYLVLDVDIYEKELASIKILNDFKLEQIAFSMLVYAKCQGNPKTISGSHDTEFLLSSGTRMYMSEFSDNLHLFNKQGLFEVKHGRDNDYYYLLKFVEEEGNKIRTVYSSEIETAGQIYKEIVGGDAYCSDCGKVMWKESNRQKRCPECQYEKQLEHNRNYKRQIR